MVVKKLNDKQAARIADLVDQLASVKAQHVIQQERAGSLQQMVDNFTVDLQNKQAEIDRLKVVLDQQIVQLVAKTQDIANQAKDLADALGRYNEANGHWVKQVAMCEEHTKVFAFAVRRFEETEGAFGEEREAYLQAAKDKEGEHAALRERAESALRVERAFRLLFQRTQEKMRPGEDVDTTLRRLIELHTKALFLKDSMPAEIGKLL